MQVFDAVATRALLPAAPLVDAVAAAMRARRAGRLKAPERLVLPLPLGGRYLVMPAADDELAISKLITVHAGNRACGLPMIQGQVLVADARDGRVRMALDGPTVTARRTAAVTVLGLRLLAGQRPLAAVALVGCGVQALEHARLLAELGAVRSLHVVGRDAARARAWVAEHGAGLAGVALVAHAELGSALEAADAVITLTDSLEPVLPDDLRDALLVAGVGAFRPDMAELPPGLLRRRRVVVDALDGARHEAGDLIRAGVDWSQVRELVELLDGATDDTVPVPVLKTVGHAGWDLAAARLAVAQAGGTA